MINISFFMFAAARLSVLKLRLEKIQSRLFFVSFLR